MQSNDKIEVKFSVEYRFDKDIQKFSAKVKAEIPCKDGRIPAVLICESCEFFGSALNAVWGNLDSEALVRWKTRQETFESLDAAQRWARSYINAQLCALEWLAAENREVMASPKKETYAYSI